MYYSLTIWFIVEYQHNGNKTHSSLNSVHFWKRKLSVTLCHLNGSARLRNRKCSMTQVVFVAELRHFLQYVFINWRCELSPYGFSQLPVRTVDENLQALPPALSPWLSSIASYLVSPFFPHATVHAMREYAFNECSPSPGPFSPSQTQPLLSLQLSLTLCNLLHVCKLMFHQSTL